MRPFYQPPFYYNAVPRAPISPYYYVARSLPPIPVATAATPKLENFLQTANSFMSNAQKFTPYIQQATPLFKNLPALWRMYKSFKDVPAEQPAAPRAIASPPPVRPTPSPPISRPSLPRIYQP